MLENVKECEGGLEGVVFEGEPESVLEVASGRPY